MSAKGQPPDNKLKSKMNIQVGQFIPEKKSVVQTFQTGPMRNLMDLELLVSIELGRKQMLVKDILALGPGDVVDLNKYTKEPVDIYINQKKYAEGEVIIAGGHFSVRITALVGPKERFSNLKRIQIDVKNG